MSTLMYAAMTAKREEARPNTSTTETPGVGVYVDALSALVPAEVLAAHAAILTFTTQNSTEGGKTTVTVTEPRTLWWTFWALTVISMAIYFAGLGKTNWDRWDWGRILLPAAAFVGWTMLQKGSAFDAVAPDLPSAPRTAIAILGAVVLALVARSLAYRADRKEPEREKRSNTEERATNAA